MERLHLLAGSDHLSPRDLRTADERCRTVWEMRSLVTGQSSMPLGERDGQHARDDLIDLVLMWTDLKQRVAPDDQAFKAESRIVLGEVQWLCGPSHAVARAEAWPSTGRLEKPAHAPIAKTFHDHAALGRALFREGLLRVDRAAGRVAACH